jgi:hypothetical protein
MENEFPAAGGSIDVFRQALKADVSAVKIGDPLNEVFEGSAKAIQAPDNQGVPVSDIVEGFGQTLPLPILRRLWCR